MEAWEHAAECILVWTSREGACKHVLMIYWGRDKGCVMEGGRNIWKRAREKGKSILSLGHLSLDESQRDKCDADLR